MKVLVTGGAGYIGSIVTSELLKAGNEVVVYDNLSTGNRAAVLPEAELVVGDIADRDRLDQLMSAHKFDGVMHFAALIEAGESMKVPTHFFRNNHSHTLTLLEAMLAHGIDRFVFSSTAALYGNPERTPIEEDDRLRPTNPYGESKLLVEQTLNWLNQIHGLKYACLRYFNAAGATAELGQDHHPESHLIPLTLQVPLGKRKEIAIYGTDYDTPDGTCVRDYIHIVDLASAHILSLKALGEKRSKLIYNLGTGTGFTVRQVIEVARKVTGHPIPVVETPRRPGDPAVLIASSRKIQSELGWKPKYPELEAIIASEWAWFEKHPQGYGTAVQKGVPVGV